MNWIKLIWLIHPAIVLNTLAIVAPEREIAFIDPVTPSWFILDFLGAPWASLGVILVLSGRWLGHLEVALNLPWLHPGLLLAPSCSSEAPLVPICPGPFWNHGVSIFTIWDHLGTILGTMLQPFILPWLGGPWT